LDQRVETDARCDPLPLEDVDDVFGRDVALRARRERAAADAADRAVDEGRARLERGEDTGERRSARVVQMDARRRAKIADAPPHRPAPPGGTGDPARAGDPALVGAACDNAPRECLDDPWIDAALVGAPERTAGGHRDAPPVGPCTVDDGDRPREPVLDGRAAV